MWFILVQANSFPNIGRAALRQHVSGAKNAMGRLYS
jgi:hypothetical protein